MVQTTFLGSSYDIKRCTVHDIDPHYEMVREWVGDVKESVYKSRMEQCVRAGTAVTLSDGSCFLYYLNSKPWLAEGVSAYGKGSPKKFVAMCYGNFSVLDQKTFTLKFGLHQDQHCSMYKHLLLKSSIRHHLVYGHPLVVRVDHLKKRFAALEKKRKGLSNG